LTLKIFSCVLTQPRSIIVDQPNVVLVILSGCFKFFRWQVCIIIGGIFPWNIYNLVQKTGAKIFDVTRSALFHIINSRELHCPFIVITDECTDKFGETLGSFVG
jgi:hypothetical protein